MLSDIGPWLTYKNTAAYAVLFLCNFRTNLKLEPSPISFGYFLRNKINEHCKFVRIHYVNYCTRITLKMLFKAILNFEFVKVLATVQNAHVKGYVIDVLNQ